MVMPLNLLLVRHGQSEGNVANRLSRDGDHSAFDNQDFNVRHSSKWRLTQKGEEQARLAGDFIQNLNLEFQRGYSSPFYRARETAALLGIENISWYLSDEARERFWGDLDSLANDKREQEYAKNISDRQKEFYYWRPVGGESLAEMRTRLRDLFSTIYREMSDKNVIIVCHGEVMALARCLLERKPPEDFHSMWHSETDNIGNCSVLHYSKVNPHTSEVEKHLNWVRLNSPGGDGGNFDWQKVIRKTFSNQDLLESVSGTPKLIG